MAALRRASSRAPSPVTPLLPAARDLTLSLESVLCVAPECITCSEWDCDFGYAPNSTAADTFCLLGDFTDPNIPGCSDDLCCNGESVYQ